MGFTAEKEIYYFRLELIIKKFKSPKTLLFLKIITFINTFNLFLITFSQNRPNQIINSMSLLELTELEIINGISSTIIVAISMAVGLRLSYKFVKHKIKVLLTMGFAWILLFAHWWGNSLSFILYVLMGFELDLFIYITIEHIFMPLTLLFWFYSFSSLMYPKYLKNFMAITYPLCLSEFILLLVALSRLLEIHRSGLGPIYPELSPIIVILKAVNIIIFTITSFMYGWKLQSEGDKKLRLKGKFFLIGITSFSIGALLSLIYQSLFELNILRFLLISSSIEIYLSFLMPERMVRWFIKEDLVE